MSRRVKAVLIESIARQLDGANGFIVVDASRTTGVQANKFRLEIKKRGYSSLGVKSGLARVASKGLGRPAFADSFSGASTVVFGTDDLYVLCRDVSRIVPDFGAVIVFGVSDGVLLDSASVAVIANGFSRHEWICEVVSSLLSAGANLVSALNSHGEAIVSQVNAHATESS